MQEWIKKTQNLIFLAVVIISVICATVGGIRLYGLLDKGFSVFSVKASIVKLVIDAVLVMGGLISILAAYKIKWMYETRLLLNRTLQEYEEILAQLKKEGN